MNTPICDFVKKYSEDDVCRLHMPGHKGLNFVGCENHDITEISGADSLYCADGIIAESEKNATKLFGSKATFYSTEGSSQCVKAMLLLAKIQSQNENFTVIAARNVHKSFINACALLNIKIRWIFDESVEFSLCSCNVTPENLKKVLTQEKADAVYVTSPDYLGGQLDLKSLSDIAHSYGALMLVDNAHGAYLKFLEKSQHPIDAGVDMCCDSAHKTLPVLTGGAYLHICNDLYIKDAKKCLEVFGSTSPSYLILQSLDMCNGYLENGYEEKLKKCLKNVEVLKNKLTSAGWTVQKADPLKLTICSSGINLSEILREAGIECEYEDPDFTVMMITPETDISFFTKLPAILGQCDANIQKMPLTRCVPEKGLEIRDALFHRSKTVEITNSVGCIVSDSSVSCPPAVPILVSGEIITEELIEIFKYYGINKINVVAE